jgi:hypothetical protein
MTTSELLRNVMVPQYYNLHFGTIEYVNVDEVLMLPYKIHWCLGPEYARSWYSSTR